IVRRQWMDSERLSYPIMQLPLALCDDGGNPNLFKNRLLYLGLLAGAALDIWNGLATFYPSLPLIVVRHDQRDLNGFFTSPPWDAVGSLTLPLYPFIIALAYFLPTDLSFSLWFFFLFKLALRIVAAALGEQPSLLSQFPYFTQQSFGAWI